VLKLGVLFDFPEEGWPSMDLAASMLLEAGRRAAPEAFEIERVCPPFRRLATRVPALGASRVALNADRLLNRMWHYPRHAARIRERFDLFHVADHSYAQLVHVLPAERTGVFCHDIDAFRSVLEPERDPRPEWFREIARRVLAGLQRAAVVFHSTDAVGSEILRHRLVPRERLVLAPYGTSPELSPTGPAGCAGVEPGSYLLHVGSCIPRKRIDVLLETFERIRAGRPGLRLVQIGGAFTPEQRDLVGALGLGGAIVQRTGVSSMELAALYRGALLVLQPSATEGFGLPVLEALACGAPVLASEIPVLREVGGDAVTYAPVGDVEAWSALALEALEGRGAAPREARLAQAARFSWDAHARAVLGAYARIAGLEAAA
jgi:glycosyltransferase involved in cell wall biosynthesis